MQLNYLHDKVICVLIRHCNEGSATVRTLSIGVVEFGKTNDGEIARSQVKTQVPALFHASLYLNLPCLCLVLHIYLPCLSLFLYISVRLPCLSLFLYISIYLTYLSFSISLYLPYLTLYFHIYLSTLLISLCLYVGSCFCGSQFQKDTRCKMFIVSLYYK